MAAKVKSLKDMEKAAKDILSEDIRLYFTAGAGTKETPKCNENGFRKYQILPRVLCDVSNVTTSSEVLKRDVSFPVGVAPVGLMGIARDGGEKEAAKASAAEGCIMILSSVSTCSIEDVSKAAFELPSARPHLWMQIYIFKDRHVTLDLVTRAEQCGFSAIVVTVDSPVSGLWKNVLPNDFVITIGKKCVNLPCETYKLLDPSTTFEDLKWLRKNTRLPIVVKGIMNAKDAVLAAEYGASAILVSNHGGRQIEDVHSTMGVLEEVLHAVRDRGVEVYMDGGVRSGSDIFKALAVGAKAVFIGRPIVWGVSVEGENGVRKVLQILKDELRRTMQLSGAVNIGAIDKSMVRKCSGWCKL